jgi:hypothetical protein
LLLELGFLEVHPDKMPGSKSVSRPLEVDRPLNYFGVTGGGQLKTCSFRLERLRPSTPQNSYRPVLVATNGTSRNTTSNIRQHQLELEGVCRVNWTVRQTGTDRFELQTRVQPNRGPRAKTASARK